MMQVLNNGTYVLPNVIETIALGTVVDERVIRLERAVCDYYKLPVSDLKNWKYDTEAKKMLCFLLHHYLQYSIGSISSKYHINKLYLRNFITDFYKTCLLDSVKLSVVNLLINDISIGTVHKS